MISYYAEVKKKIEKVENKKKSKKGGARPGAGRKPKLGKAIADYQARQKFKEAFDRNITDEDWDRLMMEAKKDKKLITYMIDQRIGKAAQSMELTGKDGGAIAVDIISYKKLS